jgi:hypothetical protein
MSSQELSNVNQENQVAQPGDKHYEYDSGWRQEADGSQWREKGESNYKKTESNTDDGGFERKESYLYFILSHALLL